MLDAHRDRRQGGAVQVLVAVALVAILGFAALAIDNGYMMVTRTQLQAAADAGAHAAIAELRSGMPFSEAAATAQEVSNQNYRSYAEVDVTASEDVEFGSYDFVGRQFLANDLSGASALRVTARRQTPFFLAQIVGFQSAPIQAQAVGALGARDVVLVQDVTYSFLDEIEDARDALTLFTQAMVGQSLAGDQLGLVTFNEAASLEQELVELPDSASQMLDAIDQFEHCYHSALPMCGGTHIAPGLDTAVAQLATSASHAEKVIVLVSDGVPCRPLDTPTTVARRNAALAAAEAAEEAGVSIYAVFLDKPFAGGVYCYGVPGNVADPSLMQELVTGSGQFYETPDEEDLDDILLSIVGSMPVRLVE